MYVIKATQNAPSIALKIKSFSLIENVAPAAFELHDVVEKPRDRKPSRTPSCRKPIKHNEFHNVKSVACSIGFFFFLQAQYLEWGKCPSQQSMVGKTLRNQCGRNPGAKEMRGSGVEIKPLLAKSFLCGQQRNPFRGSETTKLCLLHQEDKTRQCGLCLWIVQEQTPSPWT